MGRFKTPIFFLKQNLIFGRHPLSPEGLSFVEIGFKPISKFVISLLTLLAINLWTLSLMAANETPGGGKGPISVTADQMTSDDNNQVVTFIGKVIARQNDLIITCDVMKVYYQSNTPQESFKKDSPIKNSPNNVSSKDSTKGAEQSSAPIRSVNQDLENPNPSANKTQTIEALESMESEPSRPDRVQPLEGNQSIHRVECEGTVKIQQANRLAVGDKALYLVKSQPRRLILTGQARVWDGQSSVTGHQVVYYLDENRSRVESRQNQRVKAFIDQSDSGSPKR
ncbi:MAG: hypothetical protein LBV23_03715 [Deltaproteobacteria bacterium]|jgi:lipopolysaccharide export system protein LptA|nr:hypothetical protein [Deltaproteobacteria bacterium]